MLSIYILYWTPVGHGCSFSLQQIFPHKEVHKRSMARNWVVVTLEKEREELIRKQRREKSKTEDRLLLCWVLWTNLKAENEKQKSSWGAKVREFRRGTWNQKDRIGKGLGLLELWIMVQNVVLKVLILLVSHAGIIPHNRIQSTFWFCFLTKCYRPLSFPELNWRMRL